MYLTLGNIKLNNVSESLEYLITSEIIESNISFYKPIMVRSLTELDIWFGKTFEQREYLEELIKNDVSLFLYKPVKEITESDKVSLGFINYLDYEIREVPSLPNISEEDVIYFIDVMKVFKWEGNEFVNITDRPIDYEGYSTYSENFYIDSELPVVGEIGFIYKVGTDFKLWHPCLRSYINIDDLPQNIESISSASVLNRDTIRLIDPDYFIEGLDHVYPKYTPEGLETIYTEKINTENLYKNLPDISLIDSEEQTLALNLEFSENIKFYTEDSAAYIVLPDISGNKIAFWFSSLDYTTRPKDLIENVHFNIEKVITTEGKSTESIILEFKDKLTEVGYNFVDNVAYLSSKIDLTYFYSWPGFSYSTNLEVTYNILTKFTESVKCFDLYSKTIGSEYGGSIKVKIEPIKRKYQDPEIDPDINMNNALILKLGGTIVERSNGNIIVYDGNPDIDFGYYRMTISRYDYSEVYEGNVGQISNNIRNNSLLVEMRDFDSLTLPIGEWELKRAVEENNYEASGYQKSLDLMFRDNNYIDFYLIPNVSKYVDKTNTSFYRELYTKLLEYSNEYGFQVLIQNSDYAEGHNDYLYNYTQDVDNRLIYFYKSMYVDEQIRPGYFVFLSSVIDEDYSVHTKLINYESPVDSEHIYDPIGSSVEQSLISKKCNYLTNNNHFYYYKKYQNGETFNTSIWMRFCLGKVQRELEKNKWLILGQQTISESITNIEKILTGIQESYSIIRNIELLDYEEDVYSQELKLTIETEMSDFAENIMSLDITINYN